MPLLGIARSCSLTDFKASARLSVAGSSTTTGKMVVNQPMVRDKSTPSTISSRP